MNREAYHADDARWGRTAPPVGGSGPMGGRLFGRPTSDARLWLTIAAVVAGAGALAAAIVWQGEQATAQQRAANRWQVHTLEVLAEVGRFSTALSEVQRGARGYLLTGNPQCLVSYRAGLRATPDSLRRLQALTVDNPVQEGRLSAVAADVAEIVGLSEREVRLEASGRHEAALALERGGTGNTAMQRALAISNAVVDEEQRLLSVRRAAAAQATSRAAAVTIALAIAGAVVLVVAVGLGSVAFVAAARARLALARAEANERQAAMAALLSLFIAEAPAAIAMFDRQMRYLAASRRYAADYALPAGTVLVGRSHYEIFPEIPQRWREIHARVLAGGTESCDEDPFPRADGRLDWVHWRMEPWRDAQGAVAGALLFSEVITAQVQARQAHFAAEARLRSIVETAADAIVVIDEAGVIQSANPATEALFGYGADALLGLNVCVLMSDPNRSAHDGDLVSYLATIIGAGREVEGLRQDGSIVPIDLAVAEWREDGRRFFTGLMRDVSARKIAEAQRLQAERRELVVGELRHRINNMFNVLSALVMVTARSHGDVGAYRDALLSRMAAFAAAQVELAKQGWSSLGLRELVEFELRPYAEDGRRISIQGEALSLNGAAAESLAMVVHELATNAAKYGALSRPDAVLDIRWSLADTAAGEAHLVLDWTERGGPTVAPPQRRGFGSTVIENSARAVGGTARFDYAPEGLRCSIDAPASRMVMAAREPAPEASFLTAHPGESRGPS